jgi:pimeloyl-ACP methyl ester carboxylesterase
MRTAAKPVVLVSGQLLTAAFWAPVVGALGQRHFFIMAEHTQDDTIAGMAARLLREAPERFDLVAHAMGGFVAFEVLRQAPERVRKLVLMSTLAPNDGPAQTARRQGYVKLVEDGNFAGVVEERIPILVHPDRRSDEDLLAIVRGMALDTGAETFLRQQRAIMGRADSRPSLAAIRCPTLLVWGREDGITTQAHQDEMLAAIPSARLAVVEDCGHLVTLERPEACVRILGDWLGG